MASTESSATLVADEPNDAGSPTGLRLNQIRPILVLSTHMNSDELHAVEDALSACDAPITYDVLEARIFIGKVERRRRAAMELRKRGLLTEDRLLQVDGQLTKKSITEGLSLQSLLDPESMRTPEAREPAKIDAIDLTGDSTTEESEGEASKDARTSKARKSIPIERAGPVNEECLLVVIKSEWLFESLEAGRCLPLEDYTVYVGTRQDAPHLTVQQPGSCTSTMKRSSSNVADHTSTAQTNTTTTDVLSRVKAEGRPPSPRFRPRKRFHGAVEEVDKGRIYSSTTQVPRLPGLSNSDGVAPLIAQSTTEHDIDLANDIPEPPEWVRKGYKYACQRSTPVNNPNRTFIDVLKKIRLARELTDDQIGVRAYSTAIASLGSYPYTLTSPREIVALPGCSARIAKLFVEWKNCGGGDIEAIIEIDNDPRLNVLRLFYEIWGVGPTTARDFCNRGWRDLDDVVEYGWNDLSRVQQIGVKFYEEFQTKIPREEVEQIASIVHEHVQRVCGDAEGVRTCIVGGYRRGKAESGDADIMVSHLDEARLLDMIDDLVDSLYQDDWITHDLGTTRSGSRRGLQTLPYSGKGAGAGFDTLDKAMLVWQDPRYDVDAAIDGKNPNVHRRVDIIISPWRTIGCAVLGWSAGTTFERDLRRYAKYSKGWKFDSSGIRDRATGDVVDVEAVGGRSESIEEAERKVFEGLGLEYKEPWERCTG